MKKREYILIAISIICLSFAIYFTREFKNRLEPDTSYLTSKIDSLNTVIKKDKKVIEFLKKDIKTQDLQQSNYEKEADSLRELLLQKNYTYPEIINIQEKEITALRTGLKICNKSKGIYKVTLGICEQTITNTEIITFTNKELNDSLLRSCKKQKKKGKIKAFFLGFGLGYLTGKVF